MSTLNVRTVLCSAPVMTRLESTAVPQADDLDKVRIVVDAIAKGVTDAIALAEHTGFSLRHVEYRLRAARSLGLVATAASTMGAELTAEGRTLLATGRGSEEERLVYRTALAHCLAVEALAPDLFDLTPPSRDELASRIVASTAMAESTALRRASTLLSWRRRLASRQLDLFGGV